MTGKLNLDLGDDYAFDPRRARYVAENPPEPEPVDPDPPEPEPEPEPEPLGDDDADPA